MAALKQGRYGINKDRIRERGSQRPRTKFDSILKDGTTRYTPKPGINTFRVVCDADEPHWAEIIYVHERIGTKSSTYLCPKKMLNKPCPPCDAADEAARAGDKEEADALRVKERALAYIIDRDDEKAGLKVYEMSWTRENEINIAAETKKGGAVEFPNPDSGYDINIHRTGTGLKTRYTGLQIEREPSPLSESQRQADAWLEEARKKPLKTLLKYYDADYLADILTGKVEEKDEDEEDSKPPRSRKASDRDDETDEEEAPRRARKRNVEPDDDADDVEDVKQPSKRRRAQEEDDEEYAPVRPSGRSSLSHAAKDVDDDPEAGEARRWRKREAAEADEDAKPTRRSRAPRDEEDEAPAKPARRRTLVEDDEEEDPEPPRRTRRPAQDEEDEPDERPARPTRTGRRGSEDEDEGEDNAPPPRRRRPDPEEDEDERPIRRR